MKVVTNSNGTLINYDVSVTLMDCELCEKLNAEIAPCTEQEFFTAYENAHIIKFGETWELSKSNPTY